MRHRQTPHALYGVMTIKVGSGRRLSRVHLTCRHLSICFLMHVCRDYGPEERARLGIKDNLVRFSCGIESYEDIRDDVLQALDAI